jgi:hypothetical protein
VSVRPAILLAVLVVVVIALVPTAPPPLLALFVVPFVVLAPGIALCTRFDLESDDGGTPWLLVISSSFAVNVVVSTVLAYAGVLTPLWMVSVLGALILLVDRRPVDAPADRGRERTSRDTLP